VSGFVDGEGSFSTSVLQNSRFKIGWETQVVFNITIHAKDLYVLTQIKSFFGGIGYIKIYKNKDKVSYNVAKLSDIVNVIIPRGLPASSRFSGGRSHFNKYSLITQKRADFILFSSVVYLMENKEHLNIKGLKKVLALKASMNRGLSKNLLESFIGIVPVKREKFATFNIPDPK
jgi:hypothetical protein